MTYSSCLSSSNSIKEEPSKKSSFLMYNFNKRYFLLLNSYGTGMLLHTTHLDEYTSLHLNILDIVNNMQILLPLEHNFEFQIEYT